MLLCDYAESVNGKLYISGAGWNLMPANTPVPAALAVLVSVPWDASNRPHPLVLELVDEDGHRVSVGEPPTQIVQEGQLETGRPAGVPHGTPTAVPLALRWPVLPLPEGGYAFVLHLDGEEQARVSFRARGNSAPG